jgi:hypothetical protein
VSKVTESEGCPGTDRLPASPIHDHVIRKGSPSLPDRPVIDLWVGAVGTARHLDVTPLTTIAWSWSFLRYPATSLAQFSSTTARAPSFRNDSGNVTLGTLTVVADATPPALSIVSPMPGQRWTNAVFTVTGTATDDQGVSNIWCQANGGGWTRAVGTTNWNASMLLTPGSNLVSAYAVDLAGNSSPTNTVSFVSSNAFQMLLRVISTPPLTSGGLDLSLELTPGLSCRIEGSTNLIKGFSLGNNVRFHGRYSR